MVKHLTNSSRNIVRLSERSERNGPRAPEAKPGAENVEELMSMS
jgi:hypothetical protein